MGRRGNHSATKNSAGDALWNGCGAGGSGHAGGFQKPARWPRDHGRLGRRVAWGRWSHHSGLLDRRYCGVGIRRWNISGALGVRARARDRATKRTPARAFRHHRYRILLLSSGARANIRRSNARASINRLLDFWQFRRSDLRQGSGRWHDNACFWNLAAFASLAS